MSNIIEMIVGVFFGLVIGFNLSVIFMNNNTHVRPYMYPSAVKRCAPALVLYVYLDGDFECDNGMHGTLAAEAMQR